MRRRTKALIAASSIVALGGCASTPTTRVATLHPAQPEAPLWAPGVGDALGSAAFRAPVITAKLNELDASGSRYANVPTD